MPNINSVIQFKYGLQAGYDALQTKDLNTIYFTTDEQRLFVGETEYTRPIQQGTSLPTGYQPPYSLFFKTDSKELYFSDGTKWTKCSNLFTYEHPTSGVTAGSYGDTDDQAPDHGGTFQVPSFTVDEDGHLTVAGVHDVTLPTESQLSKGTDTSAAAVSLKFGDSFTAMTDTSVSNHQITDQNTKFTLPSETKLSKGTDTAGTPSTLSHEGTFQAVTGFTVDDHKITAEVTTFTLPSDNDTTYTFATGDANGQIKVTPKGGSAQNVDVKGLGSAAYKSVVTSVDASENLPTSGAVQSAINAAISGVTQFDVQVVDSLPTKGVKGVIYLVAHTHEEVVDSYDEYIWNTASEKPAFEKIGNTDIDLSQYMKTADAQAAFIPKVTGETGEVAKFKADGTLESTGFTLGVSVPADAKFTDTVYTHPTYDAKTSGMYKITVDGEGHVVAATLVTKDDITDLGIPAQDKDTTYTLSGAAGADGSWVSTLTPSEGDATTSTVPVMGAASGSAGGSAGLVPKSAAGDQNKFLRADGSWVVPTDTTYSADRGISLVDGKFGHSNTKVTAETSGLNSDKTLSWSSSITLNTIKYDEYGHVSGTGEYRITMPANPNTDSKVEQAAAITANGEYPVILASSTATTATTAGVNKAAAFTYNPGTGVLTSGSFKGNLTGNAETATKATQDADGNIITATYATKQELTNAALVWGSF